MESDAEYTGTYAADYGPGAHRGKGRHPRNGVREIQGQIQQPHGEPGQTREPKYPGRDD